MCVLDACVCGGGGLERRGESFLSMFFLSSFLSENHERKQKNERKKKLTALRAAKGATALAVAGHHFLSPAAAAQAGASSDI